MDEKKTLTKREIAIEKARENKRKKKKKILLITVISVASLLLIAGIVFGIIAIVDIMESPRAVITIKDYGKVVIMLDDESAPETVERFMKLANEGYYDGMPFYSIVDGSIYSGDPTATGKGGYKSSIFGEFLSNGYINNLSHTRGVISLDREIDFNSGTSRFFILTKDHKELDGSYAAFGKVIMGLRRLDKIVKQIQPDENGLIPKNSQPIIESIIIK